MPKLRKLKLKLHAEGLLGEFDDEWERQRMALPLVASVSHIPVNHLTVMKRFCANCPSLQVIEICEALLNPSKSQVWRRDESVPTEVNWDEDEWKYDWPQ